MVLLLVVFQSFFEVYATFDARLLFFFRLEPLPLGFVVGSVSELSPAKPGLNCYALLSLRNFFGAFGQITLLIKQVGSLLAH